MSVREARNSSNYFFSQSFESARGLKNFGLSVVAKVVEKKSFFIHNVGKFEKEMKPCVLYYTPKGQKHNIRNRVDELPRQRRQASNEAAMSGQARQRWRSDLDEAQAPAGDPGGQNDHEKNSSEREDPRGGVRSLQLRAGISYNFSYRN